MQLTLGRLAWFYVHLVAASTELALFGMVTVAAIGWHANSQWVFVVLAFLTGIGAFLHVLLLLAMVTTAIRQRAMLVHRYSTDTILSIFRYSIFATAFSLLMDLIIAGLSIWMLVSSSTNYYFFIPFGSTLWNVITLVADGLIYRIERDKMAVLDGDLKGMIPVEEPLEHAAPHDAAAAKA